MYTKHARPTCRMTPILHVRKTLFSYTHSRGNSACTQNTSGLRFGFGFGFDCTDWGFWTTFHEKHTTSTCTWTPILHVRKTRLAYIHNYPNSACTENTLGLHTQLPQFCMYADHFFRTRGNSACSHMALGGSGPANEKHTTSTCTRTPILHVHIWRWELGFGFDCTLNTRNNQRSV